MGGHIVTGHVDGVGIVQSITPVGESRVFSFSIPDPRSQNMWLKKDRLPLTV